MWPEINVRFHYHYFLKVRLFGRLTFIRTLYRSTYNIQLHNSTDNSSPHETVWFLYEFTEIRFFRKVAPTSTVRKRHKWLMQENPVAILKRRWWKRCSVDDLFWWIQLTLSYDISSDTDNVVICYISSFNLMLTYQMSTILNIKQISLILR